MATTVSKKAAPRKKRKATANEAATRAEAKRRKADTAGLSFGRRQLAQAALPALEPLTFKDIQSRLRNCVDVVQYDGVSKQSGWQLMLEVLPWIKRFIQNKAFDKKMQQRRAAYFGAMRDAMFACPAPPRIANEPCEFHAFCEFVEWMLRQPSEFIEASSLHWARVLLSEWQRREIGTFVRLEDDAPPTKTTLATLRRVMERIRTTCPDLWRAAAEKARVDNQATAAAMAEQFCALTFLRDLRVPCRFRADNGTCQIMVEGPEAKTVYVDKCIAQEIDLHDVGTFVRCGMFVKLPRDMFNSTVCTLIRVLELLERCRLPTVLARYVLSFSGTRFGCHVPDQAECRRMLLKLL